MSKPRLNSRFNWKLKTRQNTNFMTIIRLFLNLVCLVMLDMFELFTMWWFEHSKMKKLYRSHLELKFLHLKNVHVFYLQLKKGPCLRCKSRLQLVDRRCLLCQSQKIAGLVTYTYFFLECFFLFIQSKKLNIRPPHLWWVFEVFLTNPGAA